MRPSLVLTPLLLCLAPLTSAQEELFEIHPAAPEDYARFGQTLDSDGDYLVIGCPWETDSGVQAGVVYVYDFPTGTELHRLVPSDLGKWDIFGFDVAIGGGLVVVGAHQHDSQAENAGAVYVFDVATGAQLGKLVAPDGDKDWLFGYDVDVDEDRIVVGAPIADGAWDGQVYVFDAQTLTHTTTIVPDADLLHNPGFGGGVAVDGNHVAIGCNYAGSVFVHDATTGVKLAEVTGDLSIAYGSFGWTLEIDGDHLLVGAHVDDSVQRKSGSVYYYDWPSQTRIFKSRPAGLGWHEFYGTSLAMTPDWILVGAPAHNSKQVHFHGERGKGAVWILDRTTGFEITKVEASDGVKADYYGNAVALSDTHFAVGAKLDSDKKETSGSVYLHKMPTQVGASYCTPAVPNSTGQPAAIEALGSARISDSTLVLVARNVPKMQYGMFLVSADAANFPGAGGGQGTLCLGNKIARFGDQVMSAGELGALRATVDLNELPSPLWNAIQAGETWRFQAWYRDQNPSGTSNFTDAVAITFVQ